MSRATDRQVQQIRGKVGTNEKREQAGSEPYAAALKRQKVAQEESDTLAASSATLIQAHQLRRAAGFVD